MSATGSPGTRSLKTAHPATVDEHRTFFGAQARHISNLAEPNANFFVLLGGQDGWLGSASIADQVALWRDGDLIQVPLELPTVRAWSARVTRLSGE